MPIRVGEDWGSAVTSAPTDTVVAESDADIAKFLAQGRGVIVRGGTLHSSLGAPRGNDVSRALPVDLLEIRARDSGRRLGIASSSVLVRPRGRIGFLRHRILLASNCGEFGGLSACPRAHPNDGRLDVIEVAETMSLRQRRQAWRKAITGSHLPHPALKVWAAELVEVSVESHEQVVVDGVPITASGSINISVLPDAGTIFI